MVVRGAGRAFCAGGDIEMAQTVLTSEAAGRTHFFDRMIGVSDVIVGLGKPVVFAIHGACVGGGAELALFADLVARRRDGVLRLQRDGDRRRQLVGAPQLLPLMVGLRQAQEMLYLSSASTRRGRPSSGSSLGSCPPASSRRRPPRSASGSSTSPRRACG